MPNDVGATRTSADKHSGGGGDAARDAVEDSFGELRHA
jgi:hypothetical protein